MVGKGVYMSSKQMHIHLLPEPHIDAGNRRAPDPMESVGDKRKAARGHGDDGPSTATTQWFLATGATDAVWQALQSRLSDYSAVCNRKQTRDAFAEVADHIDLNRDNGRTIANLIASDVCRNLLLQGVTFPSCSGLSAAESLPTATPSKSKKSSTAPPAKKA